MYIFHHSATKTSLLSSLYSVSYKRTVIFFIFCGIIVTIYVRGGKQLTDIMIADTVGTVDMIRKTILGYTSNKKSLREVLKR